jgi:hypothetical protein
MGPPGVTGVARSAPRFARLARRAGLRERCRRVLGEVAKRTMQARKAHSLIGHHQHKHWRNAGWRHLPDRRLYGELGLVNLLQLIPSMENYYRQKGLVR